jgi:putative Ca2+/H+ antiporter (TMEM165/GDT1 family)
VITQPLATSLTFLIIVHFIVLAARENVSAVVIAGIIGHGLCTGLAVLGGRMIAQRISVRTVTLIGGVVFLLFAVTALFMDPGED